VKHERPPTVADRYTHRVGLSNSRLVSVTDSAVTFAANAGNTATVDFVMLLRRSPGFEPRRRGIATGLSPVRTTLAGGHDRVCTWFEPHRREVAATRRWFD